MSWRYFTANDGIPSIATASHTTGIVYIPVMAHAAGDSPDPSDNETDAFGRFAKELRDTVSTFKPSPDVRIKEISNSIETLLRIAEAPRR